MYYRKDGNIIRPMKMNHQPVKAVSFGDFEKNNTEKMILFLTIIFLALILAFLTYKYLKK